MKKNKIIIIVSILLIVGVFWFSFNPFQTEDMKEDSQTKQEEKDVSADKEFAEVDFTLYNSNKTIKWNLNASEISHFEDDNLLQLLPVEIRVYEINDDDELLYSIKAEEGEYHNQPGFIELKGPINLSRDQTAINLNKLKWKQDEDRISGEGDVLIENPRFKISGEKLFTDSSLKKIEIEGGDEQAVLQWYRQERENDDD